MLRTSTHAPQVIPSILKSHFSDANPSPPTSGSSFPCGSSTPPDIEVRGVLRNMLRAELMLAMTGVFGVLVGIEQR